MCHFPFSHALADGNVDYFHFLTIVTRTAISMHELLPL